MADDLKGFKDTGNTVSAMAVISDEYVIGVSGNSFEQDILNRLNRS